MLSVTLSIGLDSQLPQESTTSLPSNLPQARLTSLTSLSVLVAQASMQLIGSAERKGNIQKKQNRLETSECLSSQTGSVADLNPSNLLEQLPQWSWVV